MSLSPSFKEFLLEQMAQFGPVTIKRMFGGAGVYRDGMMFAVVDNDIVYFKTDDENRGLFEVEGLAAFVFQTAKGHAMTIKYYRAPERCMDDAGEMAEWCRIGFGAALRAAQGKRQKFEALAN